MAIHVEGLSKQGKDRALLQDIHFSVAAGSTTAIIGPSGSGKSTLLRCVSGLVPFESGTVTVAGVAVDGTGRGTHETALRRSSGFVFQAFHLFPHRTVLENVTEAPIHVARKSPADAVAHAEQLLDRVGILHRAHAYPRDLSGGEEQRCAIARALAMDPTALFMDEPTSALDPQRIDDLARLLRGLTEERALTLLLVTHELRLVESLANQALVLDHGRIVEQGDVTRVLREPERPETRALLGRS